MSTSKEQTTELFEKDVRIICPKCKSEDTLKVPQKIINETKQLTTVSIPADLICEHSFQAFIDKNLIVRGYQQVDFEFSNIEFYESSSKNLEGSQSEDDDSLSSLPLFQDIIQLLRKSVDDKDILGSALLKIDGKVLYSSLTHNTLINTIREFEVRNQKKLISVKKMILELENNEKVCLEYIEILGFKFILVLIVSSNVKLGMGNFFLRTLANEIKSLT